MVPVRVAVWTARTSQFCFAWDNFLALAHPMGESNPYLKQFFATRQRLKIGLTIAGAVGGAIFGAALTVFGKILGGAPPATIPNYLWNMAVFGIFGMLIGPTIVWMALRRVPLWRTILEPLAAGVAGAAIGVVIVSPVLFLALPPVAIVAATIRLAYAHREKVPAARRLN
jgi:hypothetical protein